MSQAILKHWSAGLAWSIFVCIASGGPASAERSDWSVADQSQIRLLLSPEPSGGRLVGGLEIALEPEWYTYWRDPGEAGIPPEFDFSGSRNMASVEIAYPAPERHYDGTSVSLIYRDEVVFPMMVTPVDTTRPVTLKVQASFGVCRDVCIPTRALAQLTLPISARPDSLAKARLQRFAQRVPKAPDPGRFDIEAVAVAGDGLVIDLRVPDASGADLFVEAPEGWYVGQPAFISHAGGVSRYELPLAGRPVATRIEGQAFRFVATAGGEAIEEVIPIR